MRQKIKIKSAKLKKSFFCPFTGLGISLATGNRISQKALTIRTYQYRND